MNDFSLEEELLFSLLKFQCFIGGKNQETIMRKQEAYLLPSFSLSLELECLSLSLSLELVCLSLSLSLELVCLSLSLDLCPELWLLLCLLLLCLLSLLLLLLLLLLFFSFSLST